MEAYQRLESEFQDFVGMNSGEMVACSSGSASLHLALESLELPQGSKILMSDYNMIACPRAATLAGLTPVFIDCNPDDLLLKLVGWPTSNLISSVLATHIYGRHMDMDTLFCEYGSWGLPIIEDMAEIHGVSPSRYTDAACWSFYRNKIINCQDGEGGMCWFKDPARAKVARELRSLGFTDKHDYLHRPRGCNYRLSNVHAELILKSLHKFEENTTKRRQVEEWYNEYIPQQWHQPPREAVWVYDIRIADLGYQRLDFIIRELNAKGIAARCSFKPMSMQEEYYSEQISPNAEKAAYEVLYLPVYPSMSEHEVRDNASALINAWRDSNQRVEPDFPARTAR